MSRGTHRTWLVARRELVQRTRSRIFRISTVLSALAIVALVWIPSAVGGPTKPARTVGLVGSVPAALPAALRAFGTPFGMDVEVSTYTDLAAGEQALRDEDVEVLLVDGDQLVWKQAPDDQLAAVVSAAVVEVERAEAVARLGLTPEQASELLRPQPPTSRSLEPSSTDEGARIGLALIGVVLLFAAISLYGGFVLAGVVEEKSSRVVEVLLSRILPHELLGGKVLGIGLVGLIQLGAIGVAGVTAALTVGGKQIPDTTPGTVLWILVWFVLGYAFYSVLFAAAGSLASRQEDAQGMTFPVSMVMLAAYFFSLATLESPNGVAAILGSFLPPCAPMIMTIRIAQVAVPWWQIAGSMAVMVVSTWALIRLAGRVYAGAILRVGPRVRLRDAWRGGEL